MGEVHGRGAGTGATEDDLTFLRGFVLAPDILKSNISEADITEHVAAGLVAAHAWIAHRYPGQ